MASSGADPTRPVPRSGATAAGAATTQASSAASGADGPGGAGGDGGGSPPVDGDDRRRRNLILGGVGVVALGVAVGVGLALATDSGDDTPAVSVTPPRITTSSSAPSTSTTSAPSTTSSSSPSTTTASTTTTSTTAPAPVITSFTAPDSNDCATQPQITLAWTTVNASGVSISVDGPGIFGSFAASGSTSVPFSCGPDSHSYLLTTTGGAPVAKETRVVQQKP